MKKSSPQSPVSPRASLLAEADLFDQLNKDKSSSLWLGRFNETEIWRMWEQCGFAEALRVLKLQPLLLRIEALDAFMHALKLYHAQAAPEHLLAEFRLRETVLAPRQRRADHLGENMPRVLAIEWILLQNPYAQFAHERPALPGQTHPGLGQARRVLQWLIALARELELEGISNFPEYYHNAFLYQRDFHFYDPAREGLLMALSRDLAKLSLAERTWAIERGHVSAAHGEKFVWESDLQILPLAPRLRTYFDEPSYREAAAIASANKFFIA